MGSYRFTALTSLADVADLRTARLASLTALPELFVELNVQRSTVYAIEQEGRAGYLAARDGVLTELFVIPAHRDHMDAVLADAVAQLGITHAWAATFDPVVHAACTRLARSSEALGFSFRTLNDVALPTPEPLPSERVATPDDIALITTVNHPEVFDDPADIEPWVANGWVTLFEQPEGLVGFGLCSPAGAHTPACDIGIRVCEAFQRRGLGAWIVQRMAARARSQGLVPTAGCAIENTISRRTLERAGYVADHHLVSFDLRPHEPRSGA